MTEYVYDNGVLVDMGAAFSDQSSGWSWGGLLSGATDTVGAILQVQSQIEQAKLNSRLLELQYQNLALEQAAKRQNPQAAPVTTPAPVAAVGSSAWIEKNRTALMLGGALLAVVLILRR